jgi:RHS repeat-associated protein
MRVHLLNRPWIAGGLACVAVLIAGMVLALNGTSSSGQASTSSAETTCNLYPLAIPASAFAGRSVGDQITDVPHGADADRFTWLTWTSDPHEYTLARSLIPPGDSYLYTEPGEPSDRIVDAGDWVERVPDPLDTAAVRSKLNEHVGKLMLVPVRGASRTRGTKFDDQVAQFVVIRLTAFNLAAPARVSFQFLGYHDCRNTAPVANAQSVATQEDTALPITLTGSDAENDALSFDIAVPPQHGTLSGQAPNVVYTPAQHYHGPDSFTFRARDASLVSPPATVQIAIAAVNDPPVITSTPDLLATQGAGYSYQATATDPDAGDTLSFSLASSPDGMTIDAATGLIAWTPTMAQSGNHPVQLVVTDAAGANAQQSFTITVAATNRAPRIVSIPVLDFIEGVSYSHQVVAEDPDAGDTVHFSLVQHPQGMSIAPGTGAISWTGEGFAGNNRLSNAMCVAGSGQTQGLPAAADVVVVVDESGSMTEEQDWVEELVGPLEAHLNTNGIGTGTLPNRYGVMGYDWHTRAINVGSGWMGSHLDFPAAARQLDLRGGGSEDGWVAVQFAATQYPLRDGAAHNIILVTDEGRSNNDNAVTYDSVLASLRAKNALLNAVVNARFTCGDGSAALGMGQGRIGYKADGRGGFQLCTNVTASNGESNTLTAYVDLAIASGGAAWDISMLSGGGATAQSFTNALLKIKAQEIQEQIPTRSRPDAYVRSLQARDGWIDVEVGNRGLAPLGASIALQVFADDTLIDIVPVNDLAAGAVQSVRLPWPMTSDPARLRARLVLPDAVADCSSDNNGLDAAWVRVRATDSGGLFDEQAFSVQPVAGNRPPRIDSAAPTRASVGRRLMHAVQGVDPDRGDALAYRLDNAPVGMTIDRVTGALRWVPDASQLGTHAFTITVTDLSGASAQQSASIVVDADAIPPRFTTDPDPRAIQGTEYRYDPVVAAAADATLSFDLFYAPPGMTVSAQTGAIRWNVPANFYRMTDVALLRVRDQFGNYDIQHFKLHGDLPNQAPVFTSTPGLQATVGLRYSYGTAVNDANVLERFLWRIGAGPAGFAMTSQYSNGAAFEWPAASVSASHPAALAEYNPTCVLRDPATPSFEPELLWSVTGARAGRQVLVGPILDMDLDRELTSTDLVAAIVVSSGRVDAWDARTGRAYWTSTQRAPSLGAQPALADLDGSGAPAVLYVDANSHLVALDAADGVVKWVSAAPVTQRGWFSYGTSAVVVSDLDGDGKGEIIAGPSVYAANGTLKWQFTLPSTTTRGTALAVDLDGDGRREVVHRGEVRDAAGALLARTHGARSGEVYFGYYASVQLPGQSGRHVIASESAFGGFKLSLSDAKGRALWSLPVDAVGPVIVADFTGDGVDDIHVPALNALYDLQGQRIWKTQGGNGNVANDRSATVADIDRDGELDILTFNTAWSPINVISGRTGAVVASFGSGWSNGDNAAPTLVDLDGDGQATLYFAHAYGVYAYRSGSAPWHSAARVSHQLPFALDHVRADLRLRPADPAHPPAQSHVVSGPLALVPSKAYLPDLRVSAPSGLATATGITLRVDVVNRGTGASVASQVVFHRNDASGTVIGQLPVPALEPGQSVSLSLPTSVEAIGEGEVLAVLDVPSAMQECETRNNRASGRVMRVVVSDHGGLEASQTWVVGVNAAVASPEFTSTAPTAIMENQTYRYRAQAVSANIGDAISYALTDAPVGMRINALTGEVTWQPQWGQTGRFNARIEARNLAGTAAFQSFSVDVAPSTVANRLPAIVSQPVTAATLNQVYRYDVRATDPDGHAITYSLGSAPAGMRIETTTGRLLWQPATVPSAPVQVVVVATDERQGRAEQAFTIQVYATPNRAPVITSRPDLALSPGTPWQYTVNATDADGDALTVVWNRVPAGMAPSGADATWTPTVAQAGEHEVEVEVRDTRGGVARQAFTLFVNDPANNAAPRVTSTPNPRASAGSAYAYAAVVVDDDGDPLRYALSQRPRGMTIDANSGAIAWTPGNDQLGDHLVVLQVSDGRGGVVWQSWTVRVEEYGSNINRAPRISTVAPLTGKVGRAYRYDLAANDPDGDLLAYSLAESPAGMTIDAQTGRIDWMPDAIGSHAVRVRVSDGLLWTEQSWTLQVKDAPLTAIIDPATALLSPNEPHAIRIVPSDAASQVHVALTLDGVLVPVEDDLTAIVSSATPGRHVLVALVNDGYDTVSVEAEFHVLVEGGADAPVIAITAPVEGGVVTAPTTVTGSVSDADLVGWTLTAVDRNGGFGRELARGTAAVSGTLGSFDPTLLLNGQYALVLHAWDAAGNQTKATRTVVVEGDMKLGHFSVTFEDVSVPVMGIPITITRTYDTRRSGQSLDFGHGWTVDYQNVRLHESRQLGLGWRVQQSGSGLFSNWCVRPQGDPVVTVALPNGSVEKFRAKAMPECQFLVPPSEVELVFEPMPGTYSQLSQTRYGALRVVANELVDLNDEGGAVDPDQYRLTLKDGTVYDLDQRFGLRKVSDAHGNSLSFSREGVSHSTGVGVRFIRDAAGRIVRMELPDGTALRYAYDANGDLVRMTDQVDQSVRYGYLQGANAHYLQDIVDPRNIRVSRNEYDADGRLVAQIDADGKRVEYTLDLGARTQSVKNRLDEVMTYVFDERGRVLLERNALNETIRRTYDALGNTLSEENGEGETTRWTYDAAGNKETETNHLGQTTRWTYDRRGQVISQTNANGDLTSFNRYDNRSGDLTSTEDGTGARTDLVYGTGGTLLELRQPENVLTTYGYNSRGDKTYERGPDGVEISHLYDAAGRARSESRTFTDASGQRRTLTTQYRYDDKGRLVETIDHANRTTRTEYNAIDKVSAQVDALGRRTEMVYDARGNHTETHYPDGTSEITVYDEENRVVAKIDRGQRTTTYVHDDAGRVVETRHPDSSIETVRYDKAGREISRTDARSNTTTFVYDDAGRLLSTTNALNQTTSTTYRPDGSKASVRDALGRVTKFEYDGAGRLVTTIHPDNTPSNDADNPRSHVAYDALGRKRSQTDEMQRTTTFEYNAAGQLTAVVDALQQRTVYGYDSRGRKVSQTDALNRTTRWEYDDDGRVVARVLPLGQRETMAYDAIGRLSAKTDFNGARTTYRYDAADRVEEVRHADGTGVVTTYTDSGQVETQTDAAGTTHHLYDARDRLLRITHPDGVQIAYQYDAAGNRTRMTTAQQDIAYTYDPLNRLETVVQGGQVTRYAYTAVGSRERITLPTGARTDYTYDVRNRLHTLTHYDRNGSALLHQTYTVDASGLRTQLVEYGIHIGATRTVAYAYDPLKRLVREEVSDTTRGNRVSQWTYDAVGNRQSETRTKAGVSVTTTYAYDANDRLQGEASSDGTTTSYAYDANGSLTGKQNAQGTSVYSYDGDRRLVDAITPNAGMTYRYDANGIRQSQTVNGVTTRFVVDPTAQYAQVLEERSSTGNVLYLLGDDRIARTQGGQTRYLHTDGQGSTRLLTDSTTVATDRWWYEAFGEVETSTGTSSNAFLFAGEQLDPSLGHYYLRARYMDPANGRFTQMDLFSGYDSDPVSLHKYLYANGSPVSYRDPSGYFSVVEASAVNKIIGHLTEFNVSSAYDLGNKLANPGSDAPSFEGWSIVASMVPFATLGKIFGRAKIISRMGVKGKVAWASAKKQPAQKEIDAAMIVSEEFGVGIYLRGNTTKGADAFMSGVKFEIKSVKNANGVYGNLRESINRGQATRFIVDGSQGLTEEALMSGIRSLDNRGKKWDEIIAILADGRIIRLPGDGI